MFILEQKHTQLQREIREQTINAWKISVKIFCALLKTSFVKTDIICTCVNKNFLDRNTFPTFMRNNCACAPDNGRIESSSWSLWHFSVFLPLMYLHFPVYLFTLNVSNSQHFEIKSFTCLNFQVRGHVEGFINEREVQFRLTSCFYTSLNSTLSHFNIIYSWNIKLKNIEITHSDRV